MSAKSFQKSLGKVLTGFEPIAPATISFGFELITPAIAEDMLSRNPYNRKMTMSRVRKHAKTMSEGNWDGEAMQGIIIDWNNNIQTGQHRLAAVVLTGLTIRLHVSRGANPSSYQNVDDNKPHTDSDALGITPRQAADARLACNLMNGLDCSKADRQDRKKMFLALEKEMKMMEMCPKNTTPFFSSSPMRLGAMLRIAEGGDKSYILKLYSDLVECEGDNLPPIAKTLVKRVHMGGIHTRRSSAAGKVIIAWRVFDQSRKNQSRLNIGGNREGGRSFNQGEANDLEEIKGLLSDLFVGQG